VPKTSPNKPDARRLKMLGQIFRLARENLRYSYRELSELSGVSASQLLRMESGEFDFSVTKFMSAAESLGLSAGIVLETVMHRDIPRQSLMGRVYSKSLEAFVRKSGVQSEQELEERMSTIAELIYILTEAVATLILSSHPEAQCFYFTHVFEPIQDRLHTFGHTRVAIGISHHERVASLKSLFDDPYATLTRWEILDEQLVTQFLEWATERHKRGESSFDHIINAWINVLLGSRTNQLEAAEWNITKEELARYDALARDSARSVSKTTEAVRVKNRSTSEKARTKIAGKQRQRWAKRKTEKGA
jgi:transcriptional regulator with XRE-family HTH domain